MIEIIKTKEWVIKEIVTKPLCPKCNNITAYSKDDRIPKFCPMCKYDLSRPINPIRNFFHKLFWSLGGREGITKYQLAHYDILDEINFNLSKLVGGKR